MRLNMSRKNDGNVQQQNAKVLQLGFNISVSGDPNSDFQIVLDDKGQDAEHCGMQLQQLDFPQPDNSLTNVPIKEVEKKKKKSKTDVKSRESHESVLNQEMPSLCSTAETTSFKPDTSSSKELALINDIKNTMEHFDKFSDHIKEIPRFKLCPVASSTPFPDKQNSKSESCLMNPERRPRRYSHLYNFNAKKDYGRATRQSPSDLFLRPLPGADLYKRGMFKRYDYEPLRTYGSVDSLTKPVSDYKSSVLWKPSYEEEKYEFESTATDGPMGILKRSDSDYGERSNSSGESIKDIKIYQNGGILIMQNFKDNFDGFEKKEISDYSNKLIENCNKLKEEIECNFPKMKDRALIGNSSEESQTSGKMVHFDMLGSDYQKNKLSSFNTSTSKDDSLNKAELIESNTSGILKHKDSHQGNLPPQDFTSMSTQENDSIISNPPGMSPGTSGKKLEWDSGADVGYLNLDLSKENLSTIERIVLRGLSSDGQSEKDVVYEKTGQEPNHNVPKYILERKPSDVVIEEIELLESQMKNATKEVERNTRREVDTKKSRHRKPEASAIGFNTTSRDNKEPQSSSQNEHQIIDSKPKSEFPGKSNLVDLVDKSINVNTLFLDDNHILPIRSEPASKRTQKSSKSVPKGMKVKKKISNERINLATSAKEKIKRNIIRHAGESAEMVLSKFSVSKRTYKKPESKSKACELEGNTENERVIVNNTSFKGAKEHSAEAVDHVRTEPANQGEKETTHQSKPKRPNSSSSTKTVLRTGKTNDRHKNMKSRECILVDQLIQTSDCEVESVGVQAFSTNKSGSCVVSTSGQKIKNGSNSNINKSAINTSSKNIQVYGLNSSLPKQLAHPKESVSKQEAQNTKGTQFYGGPINSLPNYHSNLVTKPVESCGRMLKVLNDKVALDREICYSSGEGNNKPAVRETGSKNTNEINIAENKENVLLDENTASAEKRNPAVVVVVPKKFESAVASQNNNNININNKQTESNGNKRGNESKKESENGGTTSDVSCKMLTSKHLKEHGDSIDRNLIQEKYFQSQLREIEKREMISKSTSMDMVIDPDWEKEKLSVAVQYSVQSKEEETSDEGSKSQDQPQLGNINHNCQPRECSDSSQNLGDEEHFDTLKSNNREGGFDSFPSSTQTAHSWVPGMQDPEQNKSAVGRARSFEYLPGHIYESSGNLREKLPSENDQNVISGSSSGSTQRDLTDESGRDSKGRNTLVLENSNEMSNESDRLKSLDESLTQLNIVVTKLREKDDKVQKITRSLLLNLWRHNGSGDSSTLVLNSPQTEIDTKEEKKNGKEIKDGKPKLSTAPKKRLQIEKKSEADDKSSVSSLEKYYEERKALENRIAADKESQIKWIEKEIYHLNVLRGLLEKQTSSGRKKKSVNSVPTSENSMESEKNMKNVESNSQAPVYGCTISLADKKSLEENNSFSDDSAIRGRMEIPSAKDNMKYGMAVSLNGNLRKVLLLPLGVKVSMKAGQLPASKCLDVERDGEKRKRPDFSTSSPRSTERSGSGKVEPHRQAKDYQQADVMTQFPSLKKQNESNAEMSVQTDFSTPRKCCYCQQRNCVCLSLSQSEKSDEYVSKSKSSSKNSRKTNEKNESVKPCRDKSESTGLKVTSDSIQTYSTHIDNKLKEMSKSCSEKTNGTLSNETTTASSKVKQACKCESCPKKSSTSSKKPAFSSHNQCHSNAKLTCEHHKGQVCRCSNVQVQKSSVCACHVIKILGPGCCTPENEKCLCKQRNLRKTDQCCQTEETVIERKDLVTESKLVKPNREPEAIVPCEGKRAVDARHGVEDKCLCCPKLSYDKQQALCAKIEVQNKCAMQKEVPEKEPSVEVKTPMPQSTGEYRNKDVKNKTKSDDHPRHYFLKIEEMERDELNESVERRRSLEVITVTVPVKKAGRAKIYGKDLKQSMGSKKKEDSLGVSDTTKDSACNCCEKCIGRICKKVSRDYENRIKEECRKLQTEKPTRDVYSRCGKIRSKSDDCDFFDEDQPRTEDTNYNNRYNLTRQSSSSQEGYHDSSSYYTRLGKNENSRSDTYSRQGGINCSRETPSEYNSHQDYIGTKSRLLERDEGHRREVPCETRHGAEREFDSVPTWDSRSNGLNKCPQKADEYSSEYYNYNKKEFMTKSELQREEREKKKPHRPTLQEYLESNRPDFYSSAESRRCIISERAKERVKNHGNRMELLMNLLHQCNNPKEAPTKGGGKGPRRIFTTPQMREQTMKRYRQLSEVTEKIADQKKKEEYRTNKLMADIFAKKLQLEALKGHINLSNSVSVLSTI